MDKDIWKMFDNVLYHGKVAYAHVLVGSSKVFYHVVSLKEDLGKTRVLSNSKRLPDFLVPSKHEMPPEVD